MELADITALGAVGSNPVGVRISPSAQSQNPAKAGFCD